MKRCGDSTHHCRIPTLTMNGCDLAPSTRTQSSEQEYSYLTASKTRDPSTSYSRNTPKAFRKERGHLLSRGRQNICIRLWQAEQSLRISRNLLESGNLFCSATGATKTAMGVLQLCFYYFALSFFNELGIHFSREAK